MFGATVIADIRQPVSVGVCYHRSLRYTSSSLQLYIYLRKKTVFLGSREHTDDSDFEMTTQFIILQLGKDSVLSVDVQVTV
jgi:hypothetical protein